MTAGIGQAPSRSPWGDSGRQPSAVAAEEAGWAGRDREFGKQSGVCACLHACASVLRASGSGVLSVRVDISSLVLLLQSGR